MDFNNIIIPVILTGVLSGVLGLLISVISKIFFVEKNEKIESIYKMLPGYNCGACGKAGCMGLAEDININVNNVNKCKPIKENDKQRILDYIDTINK